jgi:hypothetical protein
MSPDAADNRYPLFKVGGPVKDAEPESDSEAIRSLGRRAVEVSPSAMIAQGGVASEGLLSVEDFAGRTERDLDQVRKAIERHQLVSVSEGDGLRLPAFQLALDPDRLGAVVSAVSKFMIPVSRSSRTLWLWFVAPKAELAGSTPAQWLADGGDPTAVILAAERDAARLGD